MAAPIIQTAFASGEWAPKLQSRVDIQKYHVGASMLRNFYVDYAGGGASTRQGTKFVGQVVSNGARLIPFQPTATIGVVLEFGNGYIRFYYQGAPIMVGPSILQIASPYVTADLFPNPITGNPGLKYTQDVLSLIITHPNYPPYILTSTSLTSWTLTQINFTSTIKSPTSLTVVSTLGALASGWSYGYAVTAVDVNGQESAPYIGSVITNLHSLSDATAPGTNALSWPAVSGAVSYNVYKATPIFNATFPVSSPLGFIGNTVSLAFNDTTPGIGPDFSQSPPIGTNPFAGAGVIGYTVTVNGTYTVVPSVTVAPPASGYAALAAASLGVTGAVINAHGVTGSDLFTTVNANPTGSLMTFSNGVVLLITGATANGTSGPFFLWIVNTISVNTPGSITGVGSTTPSNPVVPTGCSATGFTGFVNGFNFNLTWGVTQVQPQQPGAGYLTPPAVTFSAGAAAATAVLGSFSGGGNASPLSAGNPGCSTFFQERLVLAAQANAVQDFDMSQPGSFFNFNISDPVQADDAITGVIVGEDLNAIKSVVQVPNGVVAFTAKGAWLINAGGSFGLASSNPITPSNATASPQAFNGASDLKPLKVNLDLLYGTFKGNYVRDLQYNIYANIYTGTDLTTLSPHLFFNYYLVDWCWAEEPFKTIWAVRNDGVLLSCGYVKEQELIGWAHHDTNGWFKSVCTVVEPLATGNTVDAVYCIVQRWINGVLVQYVERMADRYFTYGAEDAWSVDCALQTTAAVTGPANALAIIGDASAVGNVVTLTESATSPFTAGMASAGWLVRISGGIYQITGFTSTSQVTATVQRVQTSNLNLYTNQAFGLDAYTIWQPVTLISGLTQLVGMQVVGVADGVPVGPFTVSGGGQVTLANPAGKVTLGLAFTPQLRTLKLDLGQPTAQGKRKKITGVTLRVADTLGLSIGALVGNVVPMKDFTLGNVGTQSDSVVVDLVNGDGRTILDPSWQEAGQFVIVQQQPYPATILGVIPEIEQGDTPPRRG